MNKKKFTEEAFCLYCGSSLGSGYKAKIQKYCSNAHQMASMRRDLLSHWLQTGILKGYTGGIGGNTPRGSYLRDYLLEEQKHGCAICGDSDTWKGRPLKFILDHIDGDCKNNERGNLRLICPNCNSQTDTFSGRNKGNGRKSKGYLP